jgi:hypothetical protein
MQALPNRMARQLERLCEVPAFARGWFRNVVMRRALTHYGADSLNFLQVSSSAVEIGMTRQSGQSDLAQHLPAAALNLLVETASSTLLGMNVRDDCQLRLKALSLNFLQPASGNLRATASLTSEQRAFMQASDSGEVRLAVSVTDQAGVTPVNCEFIWAWTALSPGKNQSA